MNHRESKIAEGDVKIFIIKIYHISTAINFIV